ncbi:unnamed protein product, partial [Schistosoma curassoni]|uniref:Uncharacterized protein n=1 Tax=Schistosoma curassoni TaxID=6186 RepID=A0A183L3X6_9TREM
MKIIIIIFDKNSMIYLRILISQQIRVSSIKAICIEIMMFHQRNLTETNLEGTKYVVLTIFPVYLS